VRKPYEGCPVLRRLAVADIWVRRMPSETLGRHPRGLRSRAEKRVRGKAGENPFSVVRRKPWKGEIPREHPARLAS